VDIGPALLDFLRARVAKWWVPDDVVFVDELPHTATGKLLKTKLRGQYRHYRLPGAWEDTATFKLAAETSRWLSVRQGGCRQA
jgi:acyl-coenzyme A synthetase/AMP-(fatty) acid ligase